jgi:pilus assembly protein CpaB
MVGHFSRYHRNHINRARLLALGIIAALLVVVGAGVGSVVIKLTRQSPPSKIEVIKEPSVEMVDVLVASKDIEQNERLTPALFHRESIPRSMVRASTIKSFEEIANQYSRALILANMPVDRGHIKESGISDPMIDSIPKGYRVVAIRVNEVSSVEGFAGPGSYVDVHWIFDRAGEKWIQTIAQRAKVKTAERRTESDQPQRGAIPATVTLLVTEQDASTVQLASTSGSISLSLRNPDDLTPSDLKPRKITNFDNKNEEANSCPNKLTMCDQNRKNCQELCLDSKGKPITTK